MTRECPNCGAALTPSTVAPELGMARCPSCRVAVDLESPGQGIAAIQAAATALRPRAHVGVPSRFVVLGDARFHVRWRWFTPFHVALAGFFLFWCAMVTRSIWRMAMRDRFGGMLFGSLMAAGGSFGLYSIVSGLVNSTDVSLRDGFLVVSHGPLPTRGNVSIPANQIRQLYVREILGNKNSKSYELRWVDTNDRHERLVKGLQAPEEALYLEQELEAALEIPDARIDGEYGR